MDKENKVKSLSDYFSYKRLSKYEGLYGKLPCRAPTTYVGVEIELEKVSNNIEFIPSSFNMLEDGSLKEQGKEFVTVPIKFQYLEQELIRLNKALKKFSLSSRCSVHVHMNARDFTLEELEVFIMLYCIFEKSLFNLSGNRWKNNFCVPLYSYYPSVAAFLERLNIGELGSLSWYKYFALNLSPIFGGESKHKLGTVEFRHMEATMDVGRIINWINFIVSLKISAKSIKKIELLSMIKHLNTSSEYRVLARSVFKNWSNQILDQPTFKDDVESCITSLKHVCFEAHYFKSHEIASKTEIPFQLLEGVE